MMSGLVLQAQPQTRVKALCQHVGVARDLVKAKLLKDKRMKREVIFKPALPLNNSKTPFGPLSHVFRRFHTAN